MLGHYHADYLDQAGLLMKMEIENRSGIRKTSQCFWVTMKIFSVFVFVQVFVLGLASAQPVEATNSKYINLGKRIRKIVLKTKVVGVSIAIIDNYQIAWTGTFGVRETGISDSITTETLFQ